MRYNKVSDAIVHSYTIVHECRLSSSTVSARTEYSHYSIFIHRVPRYCDSVITIRDHPFLSDHIPVGHIVTG